MVSLAHLAALVEYARRATAAEAGAWPGIRNSSRAVEGGGAMMLLADRLGYVQLAEPVGSPLPGNARPRCGCGGEMPLRWTTMTSTAGSAAPRPSRPWTRPSMPTWPATWTAGTSC